ncbi:MAG: hypothetical protein C0518_09360 [Opitutus sp.]|nr:hypothetical protein [Opitutus sp.]
MSPPPSKPEPPRGFWRTAPWTLVVLGLAPKCVLCVVGYVSGGAALAGLAPELCGGEDRNVAGVVAMIAVAAGVVLAARGRRAAHAAHGRTDNSIKSQRLP